MNVLERQKEIREIKEIRKEIIDDVGTIIDKMFDNFNNYSYNFFDSDSSMDMTNMFLNCSRLSSIPDFLNNASIIGSAEQIETLRKGQD